MSKPVLPSAVAGAKCAVPANRETGALRTVTRDDAVVLLKESRFFFADAAAPRRYVGTADRNRL